MITTRKFRMKSLLIAFIIICLAFTSLTGCDSKKEKTASTNAATTQTITDDAGRKVTLPSKIEKCYYTSPIGMIMVYTLDPDKMAGWSMQLSDQEKKYIADQYESLPFLGGQQMNAKLNTEEIVKAAPNVIFNVAQDVVNDTSISEADKLQQQLNIPVVLIDFSKMEQVDEAYLKIGKILGCEKRAKELGDYCNNILKDVKKATKDIPEKDRVKVYYAEGPKGLATEPAGSSHALVLDLVNANNIAKVEAKGKGGMSEVSMEQVLAWNPEVILSWGTDRGGAYDLIKTSPDWKNINAVKNGAVYSIPNTPFNWFDRPPSVNRFIGLEWLTSTLYPQYYKGDLKKEVKEFYSLFYHVELSNDDVDGLLQNATK